ncbi:putative transcription factor MYC2-like [Capsicum annuum]|nr:putative transcription factor MYC2-like [Capsicum annuum]
MEIIFTKLHHGGSFSNTGVPTYIASCCADLERKSVGVGDSANIERESIGVEEERETDVEDFNLEDFEIENVNLGKEREADVEDLSDYLSSDSNLGDVPSEDGSDVDEELRAFRQERREKSQEQRKNKKIRKRAVGTEEVPVGVSGSVDRGFSGDIGKNKATKYSRKLGGDEEYIDSSDCWSEDSEDIDIDAVRRIDLPSRRRSKKTRYDENCEFSVFELGMIFAGAKQFRKAIANYAVEYRRQLKLKPNEK